MLALLTGTRNVLLGVLKVLEESVLVPGNALVDVGLGVREALDGTGLATEETVEVRADYRAASKEKVRASQ